MTQFGKAFEELSRIGVEAELTPNALLWREGDPPGEVVLLVDGMVDVMREGPEGEPVVVRTLDAGAILGEIATFDGLARSAAVKAKTTCRILRVPGASFRDVIRSRPDLLEELFWQQLAWIRSLTEQVARTHRPAIIDAQTRLYTDRYFRDRLKAELERARETGDLVSLAVIEVDDYPRLREADGGEAAETAAHIAQLVRAAARKGDLIGRLSEPRYGVLLYGTTGDDARRFLARLRERVEATAFKGAAALPERQVTLSAGIATCPLEGTRLDALFDMAEAALQEDREARRRARR